MDRRTKFYSSAVFSWKGGIFIARSNFSAIFWIFRGLFKLDLLLKLIKKNPQEEFCVIIATIQDMYARIVEKCRIKIEDFSMFIIINHLSMHLLLSVHSLSQVKPTHVLFHLPPHESLTLEPSIT